MGKPASSIRGKKAYLFAYYFCSRWNI